ncbi:hypothetical protein [Halomonas daqiaonensis]|uniref:Uncharacterized protein n=1 Tax=Halomonas daqiaonensis TaxID=650850 RepID=A0A1H7NZQ0_9GAMM|nr:hypothetical protein [Halomonas daqiaonensis]SEL28856.1 hypothetical protein SAMN04488129_108142 [Halomonas daqiaonensis]
MPYTTHRKPREDYAFLSMWLTGYDFRVEMGVNTNLRANLLRVRPDDRVFEARNWLEISGKCFDPEERAGEKFVITLSSDPTPEGFSETGRDFQKKGEYGKPQYRTYRGAHVPIFECPQGITPLWRNRKVDPWQGYLKASESYVSDCLTVLTSKAARYMFIHERIIGRDHWINGLSIQSGNPAE